MGERNEPEGFTKYSGGGEHGYPAAAQLLASDEMNSLKESPRFEIGFSSAARY